MANFTGKFFILALSLISLVPCVHFQYVIQVDTQPLGRRLPRFWESCGFSAQSSGEETIKFLTSDQVKVNLALIGSLPFSAIKQVRIHWLLDLIRIRQDGPSIADIHFDFDRLDGLLDHLLGCNLMPGFELMGNPSGFFNDLNKNTTQIRVWKRLIKSIATTYIDRYGIDQVMKWRFETWNEPDLHAYNTLNLTLTGYLRYIKGCRSGLDKACAAYSRDNSDGVACHLHLGGPAGLFKSRKNHKLCWGLIDYCTSHHQHRHRKSRFDICRLDFVSFHKKGDRSPRNVVDLSEQFYHNLTQMYRPRPAPLLFNDEADLLTGWWRNETWRGDVRYAAAVCKVLIMLHQRLKNRNGIVYISNDNAFINYDSVFHYFTQRTLLARFVIHEQQNDKSNGSIGRHAQVFQKPVYIAMGLLAFLYDLEVHVSHLPQDDRLSVIATKNSDSVTDDWSSAVLIVFSSFDDVTVINETRVSVKINVKLPHQILLTGGKYAVYQLDNAMPHPFRVWKDAGTPLDPGPDLRSCMRLAQGPHRTNLNDISTNGEEDNLIVKISVTMPSISLINICRYSGHASAVPGKVGRVSFINVTFNEVILLWNDDNVFTRCIKTFRVEFCPLHFNGTRCEFRRINEQDIIYPSFQYSPIPSVDPMMKNEINRGLYRIRAVDYWDRPGPYSESFYYG